MSAPSRNDLLGLIVLGTDVSLPSRRYLKMLKSGNVDVWCFNGPETIRDFADTLRFLDQNADLVAAAASVHDIVAAKRSGRIAMVLGWQNSRSLEEAAGSEWRNALPPRTTLRAFYEMGLRVANFAYNLSNSFGGGNLDPEQPLTRAGAYLMSEMQDMGVLVDCGGHTAERTSLDICHVARRPVVCTHSNVRALNDNPCNSSDRLIEAIAATGGVFGVTAVDAFRVGASKTPLRAMTLTRRARPWPISRGMSTRSTI